ncbi:MAG: DUF6089 family protein [Bacteroidota bacterium]
MKRLLFLSLIMAITYTANAQRLEFGLFGGYSVYSGDLSRQEFGIYFDEVQLAYGVFTRMDVAKALSARLSINYATVAGNDVNGSNPDRMLQFETDVIEINLVGELNFHGTAQVNDEFKFVPYLFGGIGLYNFNPKTPFEDVMIELQPLGTEGQGLPGYEQPYNLTQINFPMGIGAKIYINNSITIGLEIGARMLLTDYFDDVSDAIVNYSDILNGKGLIAAQLSNPSIDPNSAAELNTVYTRGGGSNDWYFVSGLSVAFRLSSKSRGRPTDCYGKF